jgi:hypothetical protein
MQRNAMRSTYGSAAALSDALLRSPLRVADAAAASRATAPKPRRPLPVTQDKENPPPPPPHAKGAVQGSAMIADQDGSVLALQPRAQ